MADETHYQTFSDYPMSKEKKRTFILTDGCMWEMNKKGGTYHPHAIEVVDEETGQVRYIKSGSKIQVLDGNITDTRDQESYNKAKE